jgi:hypothetical protein
MTERRPLVLIDGRPQELPKGDTVAGQEQTPSLIPPPFHPLPLELPEELRFQLKLTGLY